jgi:ribosomal protein S27E
MDPIIGGAILGLLAGVLTDGRKCRHCGKTLSAGQSEARCPTLRRATYTPVSTRKIDVSCKTCGHKWWVWSDERVSCPQGCKEW